MGDTDVMDYIKWYLDDVDDDNLIKKLKLLIFNYEKIDILLYDLEITYKQLINILCRLVPSMMTPHISKQIRLFYDKFEFAGQVDPAPNVKICGICDENVAECMGGLCVKCDDQVGELNRDV